MKTTPFILFLLFPYKIVSKKKRTEEEKFKGKSFCRNEGRLIRLQRAGEVMSIDLVQGDNCMLYCKYCDQKPFREPRIWVRQNMSSGAAREIEYDISSDSRSSVRVKETELHSLIINNVSKADIGLYLCQWPYEDSLEESYNYLLDVLQNKTDSEYGTLDQWKNYSETYLIPANQKLKQQLYYLEGTTVGIYFEVLSAWTSWTDCEECKVNPRQYRTAQCRVRPVCLNDTCAHLLKDYHGGYMEGNAESGVARLLLYTSSQLPCRGQILKEYLPYIANVVGNFPDFIQPTFCAATCPVSGGKKGPKERRLLTLQTGGSATVFCPGALGDPSIFWEYNNRKIPQRDGLVEGRIVVSHFGTLYIADALPSMKGNYTCVYQDERILELKVRVHKATEYFGKAFFRHFRYLLLVILACYIVFCTAVIVICCRRKTVKTVTKIKEQKLDVDEVPLLGYDDEEDESEDGYVQKGNWRQLLGWGHSDDSEEEMIQMHGDDGRNLKYYMYDDNEDDEIIHGFGGRPIDTKNDPYSEIYYDEDDIAMESDQAKQRK